MSWHGLAWVLLLPLYSNTIYRNEPLRGRGGGACAALCQTEGGGSLGARHAAKPIPSSRASRASENSIRTLYGSLRIHTDRMNDPVGELPTSQRTSLRASPVAFRPSPLPRVGHRGVTAWTPPAQPQLSGLPSIVLGPNHRPNQLSDRGGGGPKNQRYSDLGTPVAIC